MGQRPPGCPVKWPVIFGPFGTDLFQEKLEGRRGINGGVLAGRRVSKTVPELGAYVSAPSEVRKRAHGVRDAGFAFRRPASAPNLQPAAFHFSLAHR